CMSKMMTGISEGERDQAGIRVAAHLKQSGLTDQMLLAALDEWNKTNDPPLDDNEISRIFRQSNEGYEFGCFDEMLKERCDPKCLLYKESWNRFSGGYLMTTFKDTYGIPIALGDTVFYDGYYTVK